MGGSVCVTREAAITGSATEQMQRDGERLRLAVMNSCLIEVRDIVYIYVTIPDGYTPVYPGVSGGVLSVDTLCRDVCICDRHRRIHG